MWLIFTIIAVECFALQLRTTRLTAIIFLVVVAALPIRPAPAQPKRIVIAASVLFDGKGKVLNNTRIIMEGSKIVRVDPNAGPVDYDLRGLTVMPGWIDAHVHITWSFDKNGKNAGAAETTPYATLQAASNAWATLNAGFTTVQASATLLTFNCATRSTTVNFPIRVF